MKTRQWCVLSTAIISIALLVPIVLAGRLHRPRAAKSSETKSATKTEPSALKSYANLPLAFEPNVGQSASEVRYLAHGGGYEIFLTDQEAVLVLNKRPSLAASRAKGAKFVHSRLKGLGISSSALRLRLRGGSGAPQIAGQEKLVGKSDYFMGNDRSRWYTDVPTYGRVTYSDVYPNVDLAFYGSQHHLEYDFVVRPGGDPKNIAFDIAGASTIQIDRDGNLHLYIGEEQIQFRKPRIYQTLNNASQAIVGGYILAKDGTVRFDVQSYDRSKPLIIDPVVDYSTYLGGTGWNFGYSVAVDSNGNAYVAGWTTSTSFPTTANSIDPGPLSSSGDAAYVAEINASGTSLLYSTYFSGNALDEAAYSVAVDSANPPNVYTTGFTCSTNFPTTSNAYLQTFTPSSGCAGFVTKFSPTVSGSAALVYSTYLGGNNTDTPNGLALDTSGNIYVTGQTWSTNFPTTQTAFQSSNNGGGTLENAFVTRIDPTKSGSASLIYSSYLGGSGNQTTAVGDGGGAIAVDSNGDAYVTGYTASGNFPTTASAFMQTAPGAASSSEGTGFVAEIGTGSSGSASLVYSTYLGGSGSSNGGDNSSGIIVNSSNQTYITGFTFSSDFPVTTGAYLTTAPSTVGNVGIGFVSSIDTSQSGAASLVYSTYFGGNNGDAGSGIALDSQGSVYVTGETFSSNFPVTPGAYQTSIKGSCTGFVSELMPLGNGAADLVYSTFFGGTESSSTCNSGVGLGGFNQVLDGSGNIFVTGATAASDFPIAPANAYQTTLNPSSIDAYIAKLTLSPKVLPTPTISSLSVTSGGTGTSVEVSGSNFGINQGASTVSFGSVAAAVSSWSSTSIIVQVPSEGIAGSVNVTVTTSVGASNAKPFTVLPTIATLSPTSGPQGASVTISGYNFGTSGTVTFNGVTATTNSWNSSTVVATVPSGATSGNVVITSNSQASVGVSFTVVPAPSISSLSINSGTAGTSVTITGSNFGSSQATEAGTAVLGGATAFVTSWSAGSIVVLVPNTAAPGSGSVTVTAGGVQSNSVSFTVDPSMYSLSPYAGPVGETIVINGADFGSTQNGGTVEFGSQAASVSDWTSTAITVTVPTLTTGSVSVSVKAASITTNSEWFTVSGASGTAPVSAPPIIGLPPFASFGGGPDQIDLGNLNVHFTIPVFSKAGRGTPFSYNLEYDSSVWYPSGASGSVTWQPVNNWGWAGQSSVVFGSLTYLVPVSGTCNVDQKAYTIYYGWSYQDKLGVSHPISIGGVSSDSNCGSSTQTGAVTDGSGYTVSVTALPNTNPQAFNTTVTSKTGRQFNPPVNATSGAATYTDRNGNQISVNGSGVFTDTLGTTALTVSGSAPNPVKFGYTPPAGGTAYVQVSYKTYSIQTKFNCTGVAEYTNSSVPLVDKVTYPDGTFYQFQYELTPGSTTTYTGRVASVTLPTGGTISYTYQGGSNGVVCADGSTAGFKRYTPDTGGSVYWNYSRTPGSGAASTTSITDPTSQANTTVVQFQGIYETQRQSYQGSSTLLRTTTTCYNGNTSSCTGTAVILPVLQRNVTTQIAGGRNQTRGHVYRYDSNENLLEQDDYDYGAGTLGSLLRKKVVTYASLSNNLTSFPQQVTITDGSGNLAAKTTYSYDQGSVVTTSGSPQHVSVSGSRGNLTGVNSYTTSTVSLSRSITYFDTGNVQTVTDVNGAQTSYTYGACGNSFPTSVAEPLSLAKSMTWNCSGAVQTSTTDENSQVWSSSYTQDPSFWRPESKTDPTNAATNFTYTDPSQVESVISIGSGSSAADALSTLDSLGRSHLGQIRQAPGGQTFDTTERDYDIEGRPSRSTLPFGASAGQGSSTAPGKTTVYDALGRVSSITDSGGGYTRYFYSENDTLTTRGPAPTGQNAETHQREYDGLGRLASVCEVTSAAGSGTCGQASAQTGYWTKYTYDGASRLTAATQNAQSSATQTRSYSYDLLGRIVSANDPETGNHTYTYVYDTDSTCGTSNGDLVKKTDPVGNVTCYTYDALHRQLSVTYPSGSYATKTANKYFVYDSAVVNGVAMANTKTRLAEAFTCSGPCTGGSAPALVQSNSKDCGTAASCSLAFSSDNTAGNLIVFALRYGAVGGTVTLTDSLNNSYSLAASQQQTADGHTDYVYYGPNIAAGANTVTVHVSASATIRIAIHEYTGLAIASPLDVAAGAQGNSASVSSGNATTTDVRELIFSLGSSADSETWSGGSGFTLRQTPGSKLATEDQVIASKQTLAANFSLGASDPWAALIVTFRAASGGTTDVGFSYTVRGEPSDVYESTPNSGGYYHIAEQYFPNGVVKQLGGLSSLPTFTFNLDGEGRTSQVSASSGQNPVTNTVFNNASLPTSVTFGSDDSDAFTYDSNTNRMTEYQFTVNGNSLTGALTWNANGTLHGLNVVDALNNSDNQSCSFLYDDLARLASTDCGDVWSQTYAYDPFGNITKNGSASFQPTYNASTNQISSVAGFTPTYDNNGNTVTDPSHTYSWDSAGRPAAIDSVNITYDALGRMAEQNRSGTYTQFVYGPHGGKFAIFTGQTLVKAFLPLPGGAQAVYGSSGILYYGHSDHLGSIRVGSTSARAVSFDVAYAPFGETYAASGSTDPAFTGQREDTVNGLYDFSAREYNPQGRWPSPDPAALASAKLNDPQTLNRYAYVRNTPTSLTDPFGMESGDDSSDPCDPSCDLVGGGGGGWGGGASVSDPSGPGDSGSGAGPSGSDSPPLNTLTTLSDGSPGYLVSASDPNYSITVTASPLPDDSLQDSVMGQLIDPTQCSDCMSILRGADDVVEAGGYAEIGVAGLVSGGFALDAIGELGGLSTQELATQAADAIGEDATVEVVPDIVGTYGTQLFGQTMSGDILVSEALNTTEQSVFETVAEESMHLYQQQALGSEAVVGAQPLLENEATSFAQLMWRLYNVSRGTPLP